MPWPLGVYRGPPEVYRGPPEVYRGPCMKNMAWNRPITYTGINILAGGRPLPPEILPPSDLPSPVIGILWQMSELITQEQIAVESSNLVEG